MSVHIDTFCNGIWWQNCYLIIGGDGKALIVDPGSDVGSIVDKLESNNWQPQAIINTHAHYDHVGAVAPLMERFGIPFYMHGDDARLLHQANMYKMIFGAKESISIPEISHDFCDLPATLDIAGFAVQWYSTPGHTAGSVCLRIDNNLFSGDTLLASGVGRTDLPGGDAGALGRSVDFLKELDGELKVWAGHGPMIGLAEALKTAHRSLEKAK